MAVTRREVPPGPGGEDGFAVARKAVVGGRAGQQGGVGAGAAMEPVGAAACDQEVVAGAPIRVSVSSGVPCRLVGFRASQR